MIASGYGVVVPQAVAAVPNIPPAMLAQLKNMSPAQQAALARQYGFELPGAGAIEDAEPSIIGQPGEELTLDSRVQQRLVEEEFQRLLAEGELDDQEDTDEPLKRFGLELFDREISTFSPVDDMPAPDGYRVGPGDSINLYLYGNEEIDAALSVNREGQLILPRLGPLSVAGLTFEQVKEVIEARSRRSWLPLRPSSVLASSGNKRILGWRCAAPRELFRIGTVHGSASALRGRRRLRNWKFA